MGTRLPSTRFLLILLLVARGSCSDDSVDVVRELIHRLLPSHSELFDLQINALPSDANITSYFEISSDMQPSLNHVIVTITGSDAVALASGFHHYLKYYGNSSVSWWGDQLTNILQGKQLPSVPTVVRKASTYLYRYYMNSCTFAYSTLTW
jgi:alpha-N-acetylglucosaminidase